MLNKIVNMILLIACVCMIASGGLYVTKEIRGRRAIARVPHIRAGQTLRIPQALGKPTLLLELSPTCPHCVANEPLYRQLAALPQIRGGNVQVLIAMAAKNQKIAQDFVTRDNIPGQLIVKEFGDKFPFAFGGTPTVVLLDPAGKVLDVWAGELREATMQEVLKRLS